ncbi:MAG: FtsX-like permease family protein [Ruminococcaceae bacterium]|nr:FtsX-like permease family protein [Oscillospiraceae bacterium]
MLENILSSLRGIWSHKLRSFLTILGVIIGIAAIIAIVSIVEGTNRRLERSLVGSGNNVITVALSQGEYNWEYDFSGGTPAGVPVVTEAVLDQVRALDGVEAATGYRTRRSWNAAYYLDRPLNNGEITGISDSYFTTMQYSVTMGRGFTAEEYARGAKVAIVDENAVTNLFDGASPLGKAVEIRQEPFVVVGVVRDDNAQEAEYESLDDYYMYSYRSGACRVYIPAQAWPIVYQFDEPLTVGVRAGSTRQMASAGSSAADLLNTYVRSDSVRYAALNAQESAEELKTLTNAIQLMLVSIASLSLLVGGIGVMNIMLVSVTERTAEIGLKKALGAKKRTILAQFLTESAVLTSVGGVLGVLAGIGLAKLISEVASLEFGISVPWIIISVAFSMFIGVLFGAMPASRAARLDPIEALRRE